MSTLSRMEGPDRLSPGWWVRLEGDPFDLEALADALFRDVRIARGGDHFYLRAPDFESFASADAEAVHRRATEIVRVLNGAAQVHHGDHRPISVGAAALVKEDGSIQHYVFAATAGGLRLRGRIAALTVTRAGTHEPEALPPSPIERMTLRGLTDADVEGVLRIFGRDDVDYRDLYFIFEIVRAAAGNQIYEWASHAELDRFRRTANSPTALGEDARHGHERTDPPRDPMPFDEARELVRRLIASWLA
jgi:hypothetical protein